MTKKIYKYLLILVSSFMFIVSLYMTLQMDFISKVGGGTSSDGFDNETNPDNGNAYWTMTYLSERAVQYVFFFGGFGLISHALSIKDDDK